jgi:hypothetical protein
MSANIMATEAQYRPPGLDFKPKPGDNDADWALVAKYTTSYAGPFSLVERERDEAGRLNGLLTHGPLTFAWVPSIVQSRQMRNYTIYHEDGETLLRLSSRRDENKATGYLWWKKLGPSWGQNS